MATYEKARQTDGQFEALERDVEQYVKAIRAVQDGHMAPFETTLLADQVAKAHKAWLETWSESKG